MTFKVRVLALDDATVAAHAIKSTARGIPLTVDFDNERVVGTATVYPDGTADLTLNLPLEQRQDTGDLGFGIGYVVEKEHQAGEIRVVDQLRPVSLSISAAMLLKLQGL